MSAITIEQAIFTSARTAAHSGYHLVARSPGIGHAQVQRLTQWGPTHGALSAQDPNTSALSFHSTGGDQHCLARTVHGGPEYSGRGHLQVFTAMLIVRTGQLAGYDYDPLKFAHTAMVLGHLRFRPRWPSELPSVELPAQGLSCADPKRPAVDENVIERSLLLLARGERVALTGMADPAAALSRLIESISPRKRVDLSFTTGLKPSFNRRFQVHLLPQYDDSVSARIRAQGIRRVAPAADCE